MMTEKSNTRARARVPMGTHWNKSLLSLLLALVMVVGMVPVTALATEAEADTRKVVTKVEGKSYHMGVSGYDAPDYGSPNDYKSRPEIEITSITLSDNTVIDNPSRDVIHTLDGSNAKNWYRQVGDDWEDYSMTTYPKFVEGTYQYRVKLRLDSDENAEYEFGEHVTITIKDEYHGGEAQWKQEEKVFKNEWYITSPNYTVDDYGYLIDNTKIEGKQLSIGETKVGVAIKEIDLNSSVMGGTKPYHFQIVEGSPTWITVSDNGIVSGTPKTTTTKATELKVKVTDSVDTAKTVTLTIPVGRTFPGTDERIELAYVQVELKDVLPAVGASTDMFPRFELIKARTTGGDTDILAADIPDNAIVFDHAMGNMGCWQKWNEETGRYEGYYKTTFEEGTYRFGMLLRIQNTGTTAFGEQYKLADGFNVQMLKDGESLPTEKQWGKKNAWSFTTYSTVELTSPDYKVNNDWRKLEGDVAITCTVRTGEPISTHVSTDVPAGNLRYQWQIQSAKDGTWSNWGKLTESGSMSGNMVQADDPGDYGTGAVRVIVSAVGYEGKLISAPRPINPAVHTEEPAMPKLWYFPDKGNVIFVRNSMGSTQLQEYLLSKEPLPQERLDAAEKRTTQTGDAVLGLWTSYADVCVLGSENVFKAKEKTLYYVYTRLAGGRGYLAGKEYRYSTIYTGDSSDFIDLARLILDGYTDYGAGNTIYIKSGDEVPLTVTGSPTNANTWSNIYFRAYDGGSGISVKVDDTDGNIINMGSGSSFGSHTIKITATSNETLIASSTPNGDPGTVYGRWKVVVYDGDPSSIGLLNVEFVNLPVYSDVKLSKGDTYTPAGGTPSIEKIKANPTGALAGYRPVWRIGTSAGASGWDYSQTENEYIKVNSDTGEVTAKQKHAAGSDTQVALCLVKDGRSAWPIAYYRVTVEETAAPEGALLVNPGSLSIEKGETVSLTAQVEGFTGAALSGTYKWESSNADVATVNVPVSGGNEAEVKAIGHGDATIKVTYSYGDGKTLSAAVPVSVHQWGEWQKVDENTHRRECEKCSAVETENHYPTVEGGSSIQPGENGKTVWKCNACGYTWDNSVYHTVALDANGGTVTPGYALVSDVGTVGFLPTPERSGYSFSGWYTEKTGGTKVTGDTELAASVSTLYARWSARYYYAGSTGGTTTAKPEKSPGTGDPGVMLYAAMGLLSLSGGAWVVGRKRKDK